MTRTVTHTFAAATVVASPSGGAATLLATALLTRKALAALLLFQALIAKAALAPTFTAIVLTRAAVRDGATLETGASFFLCLRNAGELLALSGLGIAVGLQCGTSAEVTAVVAVIAPLVRTAWLGDAHADFRFTALSTWTPTRSLAAVADVAGARRANWRAATIAGALTRLAALALTAATCSAAAIGLTTGLSVADRRARRLANLLGLAVVTFAGDAVLVDLGANAPALNLRTIVVVITRRRLAGDRRALAALSCAIAVFPAAVTCVSC